MKPGIKTTEFWITVASIATTVATLAGAIGPDDAAGVSKAATDIVVAIFSIVTRAAYIWGRFMLKMKE